jgi:hypothetical protein
MSQLPYYNVSMNGQTITPADLWRASDEPALDVDSAYSNTAVAGLDGNLLHIPTTHVTSETDASIPRHDLSGLFRSQSLQTMWPDDVVHRYDTPNFSQAFQFGGPSDEPRYSISSAGGRHLDLQPQSTASHQPSNMSNHELIWRQSNPLTLDIGDLAAPYFSHNMAAGVTGLELAMPPASYNGIPALRGSALSATNSALSSPYQSSNEPSSPVRFVHLSELSAPSAAAAQAPSQKASGSRSRQSRRPRTEDFPSGEEENSEADGQGDLSSEYVPSDNEDSFGRTGRISGRSRHTRKRSRSAALSLELASCIPPGPLPLPVPVPNLTKKSRGRKVPISFDFLEDGASDKTRVYLCKVPDCGKRFVRAEHLKRHVRSIHTYDKRELFLLASHQHHTLPYNNIQHMSVLMKAATSRSADAITSDSIFVCINSRRNRDLSYST